MLYQLSVLVNKSLIFIQKQIKPTICLPLHTLVILTIIKENTFISIAYFNGFSKSQTTPKRLFAPVKYKGYNWESLLNFLPRESKAFAVKEIRTFFRDSAQWPQLFLMADIRTQSISLLQLTWSVISFVFAFSLCLLAIFYPIYLGEKKLRIR
ncbi:MAG: hypothetical protein ABFD06_11465 [Smithella sp.]